MVLRGWCYEHDPERGIHMFRRMQAGHLIRIGITEQEVKSAGSMEQVRRILNERAGKHIAEAK